VVAAVAAVVAVAALLVTTYRNASSAGDAQTTAAEGSSSFDGTPAPAGADTPAPTPTPQAPAHDDEVDYHPDARTRAAIADVTVRFLQEWKRPGTPEERTERILPYATEWLTTRLADVDPAELPTSAISGRPRLVAATAYAAGTTTRFDDGLQVRCNLVLDTAGWRVAEVLPLTETPSPEPTPSRSVQPTPSAGASDQSTPRTDPSPGSTETPAPDGAG
jgi:hypothetical protein